MCKNITKTQLVIAFNWGLHCLRKEVILWRRFLAQCSALITDSCPEWLLVTILYRSVIVTAGQILVSKCHCDFVSQSCIEVSLRKQQCDVKIVSQSHNVWTGLYSLLYGRSMTRCQAILVTSPPTVQTRWQLTSCLRDYWRINCSELRSLVLSLTVTLLSEAMFILSCW